jgi:hypothetical protein
MWEHEPLQKFCPTERKEDGTLGWLENLSGNCSGLAVLRREQQEPLDKNHQENQSMGKKLRPITNVASTTLG